MTSPPNRERKIFEAALELASEEVRSCYLIGACGADAEMRARIETLLRSYEKIGGFLSMNDANSPAALSAKALVVKTGMFRLTEKAGDRVGRYKLLQQIGEGGCGVVYMAEQEEPVRRMVALKVIKLGMDTKGVIARFEAERQALALMDHPNIAKVLDAGATEAGGPYFVMELVRGVKITDYCDQNQLHTRERLDLFVQVCQAIQHAHQKGVIHRDIKPSNILISVNDGVPVPKVIDFGIAKATQGRLTDRTLFTAFEQFIGTPAYMSPEQAVMTSLDVDTRSDIYSLGVLLYELLTGKTPFDAKELMQAGLDEMRRTILEKEPVRPSTRLSTMEGADLNSITTHRRTEAPKLIHTLRGDLDWIVMKALEKDRSRRYETANGMARDVQRYLSDEPVMARPPSKLYLLKKLVRRNKLTFAAAAIVSGTLILGLGIAIVAAVRIKRDDLQVRKANDVATEKLWASYLAESRANRNSGRAGQRFESLEAVQKAAAIRSELAVRNEAIASLAMSDLRVSKETTLKGRTPDDLVRYDFNLESYAVGNADGSITIRAVKDDRVLEVLPTTGSILRWVGGFSPNSRYLRALYGREGDGLGYSVWDVQQQKAVLSGLSAKWGAAAEFSPDGRLFATSNPDATLSVYDLASGKEIKRLSGIRPYMHLSLNPANTKLACFDEDDSSVEIRDVELGRLVLTLPCPAPVNFAAWSPDGKRLAVACRDYRIYILDAENARPPQAVLEGHKSLIMRVEFSHAGNLLASSSWDGLTRLWSADTGRQIASYPGGSWYFQFSPDDRFLEGWQDQSRFGQLEVASSRECRTLFSPPPGEGCSSPEFSADGRILAAATLNRVCFSDVFSGKEIASLPWADCDTHIFPPDGRSLIVIDRSSGIHLESLERVGGTASSAYKLGKPCRFYDAAGLREAVLCRDGRHLAVTHESEGESFIFDLQNPSAKPVVLGPHPLVDGIAISPDGRWVATSSWHNPLVRIWDARSGELLRTLTMPARTSAAFSPDGRWLATSTTKYQLWEVGSWQPRGPPVPGNEVAQWNFTAFAPDGRVMARIVEGHKIQLLEVLTEKPLATLEAPGFNAIATLQFSPDGSQLAVLEQGPQVRLWDLRLVRRELKEMNLDWDMPPYPPVEKSSEGTVTMEVESDPTNSTPALR